jgi:hypothetical protein
MTDVIIECLRFGKSNLTNGFDKPALRQYLTQNGYDVKACGDIIDLCFREYTSTRTPPNLQDETTIYFLNKSGYFDLLQFESTDQARSFAMQANTVAMWAIIISSALALGSIVIGIMQLD